MAINSSWMNNYVKSRQSNKPSPAIAPPPPKNKSKRVPRGAYPKKKKPGFFRSLAGAVAGEMLKGTGHVGKHVIKHIHGEETIHEMDGAGGLGGIPTNNASSGAVAGLGQPGSSEPGMKKKTKAPMLTYKMFKRTRGISK